MRVKYLKSHDGYAQGELRIIDDAKVGALLAAGVVVEWIDLDKLAEENKARQESLTRDIESEEFAQVSPRDRMKRRYVRKS